MAAPSICASTTSFIDISIGREQFYDAKRLAAQGKYLQAKQIFKLVIRLRPDAASPHYHLGCVLIELDCLQEAISHFKKATHLKPDVVKYKQFHKWYSILFQCKYNQGQTPGGPNDNQNKENADQSEEDDDDDDEDKEEEEDDDDIDCKNITDYNNEYYSDNKLKFNKYTVQRLLKEFCPSKFHLKKNATHKQTLFVLNKAIKLYDPRNNANEHQMYYKYNTKNHPDLNQKHLYQLLIRQKDLLVKKRKQNKLKKTNAQNFKKHAKCQWCFVPLSVACQHQIKKKKNQQIVSSHKYHYIFQ